MVTIRVHAFLDKDVNGVNLLTPMNLHDELA